MESDNRKCDTTPVDDSPEEHGGECVAAIEEGIKADEYRHKEIYDGEGAECFHRFWVK